MTSRYIHLLLYLLLDMHLGKKSRTLRSSSASREQKWVAARMGYVFRRSHHLGERVYAAMLSRGFQGEAKILEELRWSRLDLVVIVLAATLCMAVLILQKTLFS